MYKKPTSFFEFMAIFSFGKITTTKAVPLFFCGSKQRNIVSPYYPFF